MKLLPIVTITVALAAIAAPLAAQQAAPAPAQPAQPTPPAYDQTATVTLEGTADMIRWGAQGLLTLITTTAPAQTWDIALPSTDVMLGKGVSANTLTRGVTVKVNAYKAKDTTCTPNCKAQAIDLSIDGKPPVNVMAATAK